MTIYALDLLIEDIDSILDDALESSSIDTSLLNYLGILDEGRSPLRQIGVVLPYIRYQWLSSFDHQFDI
jgi:hypothetical protein